MSHERRWKVLSLAMAHKYEVISIHAFTECNMNPPCKFCYKKRIEEKDEKPESFWFDLIPYISKLTKQCALGGGECFLKPEFVKKFGKLCKKNKLIFNVTSNGKLLMKMNDEELKSALENITMISISWDTEKIKDQKDVIDYAKLVKRIKTLTKCQVGTNLLVEQRLIENNGYLLKVLVSGLFDIGIDRIFCLSMKNSPCPDILKIRNVYIELTKKYPLFFVDDAGKMIIESGKYSDWKTPCHYGKSLISINEKGFITGCSFDSDEMALLKLDKPKDLLKVTKVKIKKRHSCPFLNITFK
jgi:MoaA/NifB/PqqE/SkfB family radical SAM enzyme